MKKLNLLSPLSYIIIRISKYLTDTALVGL